LKVENNLYFADDIDREAFLLKKKRRYYQENIDSSYAPPTAAPKPDNATPKPDSTSTPRSNGGDGFSSSTKAKPSASKITLIIGYAELCCHLVTVICSVLLLISPDLFYTALKSSALSGLLYAYRTFGKPAFNKEYWITVLQDETLHFIFASLILLSSRPMLIGILPAACRSLLFSCRALPMVLPRFVPSFYSRIGEYVRKVNARSSELSDWASQIEVLFIFILIVSLFGADRNILLLFMWFQYLRARYLISSSCQRAFFSIRLMADKVFLHPRCPRLITMVYGKVVAFLSSLGDRQQLEAASQSASKCVIM